MSGWRSLINLESLSSINCHWEGSCTLVSLPEPDLSLCWDRTSENFIPVLPAVCLNPFPARVCDCPVRTPWHYPWVLFPDTPSAHLPQIHLNEALLASPSTFTSCCSHAMLEIEAISPALGIGRDFILSSGVWCKLLKALTWPSVKPSNSYQIQGNCKCPAATKNYSSWFLRQACFQVLFVSYLSLFTFINYLFYPIPFP